MVVIGIIATIVLPISIYNYKKSFIENRYKKAYSTLSNAINMSIAHNGQPEQWILGDDNDEWASQYLLPYLKVDKYCGTSSDNNCTFSMGANHYTWIKRNKGDVGSSYSRFYMADGVQVAFKINRTSSANGVIFYVDIDGNGNGENKWGKDIFIYDVYTSFVNKPFENEIKNAASQMVLKPSAFSKSDEIVGTYAHANACGKGRNGEYCATYIMRNNWKIPKDYPL